MSRWSLLKISLLSSFLFLLSSSSWGVDIVTAKAIGETPYTAGVLNNLNVSIATSLTNHKYKEAIAGLDQELQHDPKNLHILFQKASIYADTEEYDKSMQVLDQIHGITPNDEKSNKLKGIVEEKLKAQPHNEIGYDQDEAYVSDLHSTWTFANVHYFRYTQAGTFGGRVNYAHRFGTNAEQYQLEAYPKLFNGKSSLSLMAAYANHTQSLFPQFQYAIEDYVSFDHDIEGSFGERMIHFHNVKIFTYTGSVGKYLGNYFFWFRPYVYVPYAQQAYELGVRRYFSSKYSYISLKIGGGKYPDIGQIQPVSQIVIFHFKAVALDAQLPIAKQVFLRIGAGFTRQTYLTRRLRIIRDVSLGLMVQF